MSGTSRSVIDMRIMHLQDPRDCSSYGDGGRYLGHGQQIPPEERSADNLLRNHDDVAGIKASGEDVGVIPSAGSPANDRAVCPDDEGLFAVGNLVCPARLAA